MEPRARAGRHKANLNFPDELRHLLYGAGTPVHPDFNHPLSDGSSQAYLRNLPSSTLNRTHPPSAATAPSKDGVFPEPYPETLRVLDEMVTDYIIETSHAALQLATYAGRAKLKLTDFEFVMRRDRKKLGRVQEMFRRRKVVQEVKKTAGGATFGEAGNAMGELGDLRRMGVVDLQNLGDIVGEEGTGRGKGKGRGRRRKRVVEIEGGDAARGGEANGDGDGGVPTEKADGAVADEDDLGDLEVDIDNDLEADDEDKHKSKKARSEMD